MIQRTYPTSSDSLVTYLQSSEFVGAWQTASGSRMKPAGATVSFKNGDQPLEALQMFAGPESADKYAAWGAKPQ